MTWMHDDELRARFRELREEDRAHAPPFGAVIARIPSSSRPGTRRGAIALVALAAAAGVVLAIGIAHSDQSAGDRFVLIAASESAKGATPSITEWIPPTASLLATPGRELLTPPTFGVVPLDALPDTLTPDEGALP